MDVRVLDPAGYVLEGTLDDGTVALADGDEVAVSVEGIGTIEHAVRYAEGA